MFWSFGLWFLFTVSKSIIGGVVVLRTQEYVFLTKKYRSGTMGPSMFSYMSHVE